MATSTSGNHSSKETISNMADAVRATRAILTWLDYVESSELTGQEQVALCKAAARLDTVIRRILNRLGI